MSYFSPDFMKFFKELASHNTTAWFNENRKRYETHVKNPFSEFVEAVITKAQKLDPAIKIKPSDAIMRINKDIRFSKDKTPYNIHVAAIISQTGKKSKEFPGMYLMISPEKVAIYGGAYMLEKENLQKIRKHIAKNPKEIDKLISTADFKKKFGTIHGEKNKVIPPEFKSAAEKQPLIANKSFYYMAELPAKEALSPKFLNTVMEHYKAGRAVNNYLIKAMGK